MDDRKKKYLSVALFVLLCAAMLYILLVIPQHRNIGLIFRQKIYIFPFLGLLAFFAVRVKNQILQSVFYALLFTAFLLPLSGLWNSGISSQYIFAGSIPWSDAFLHHLNTMRFLFGGMMDQMSAIRPLAMTFNALVLLLTGNNFLGLYALTTVLVALSVLLNLNTLGKYIGPAASAVFAVIAYFYIRAYIGSYLTEPLSFAIGMLGCYFLLNGIFDDRKISIVLGFTALSLALNIRPGAMFVLATGGLWFFFITLKKEPRRLAWSALALGGMLIGFGLNQWNSGFVYPKDKKLTNNQAALYVYGICMGGKDTYYSMTQPELAQYNGTDQLWPGLFDLCKTELSEHPANLMTSFYVIWDAILFDNERGAFSYFDGAGVSLVTASRFGWMILWTVGFLLALKRRNEPLFSFLLAMVLGIFLFQFAAPLYNYYRMRFDAPTVWVTGLICGIAAQAIIERVFSGRFAKTLPLNDKNENSRLSVIATIAFSVLLVIFFVSPIIVRKNPVEIASVPDIKCQQDETLIFTRVDPGNMVSLKSYALQKPHVPEYHLLFVRPRIHDTSSREIFDFTDSFESPVVIGKGLNLKTYEDIMFFADASVMEDRYGFVQLCGKVFEPPLLHDYNFMVVSKSEFLSE